MFYLVAYVMHISGRVRRMMRSEFGCEPSEGVLPVVSAPYSGADARIALERIARSVPLARGDMLFVQPEERAIAPMSRDSAVALVTGSHGWSQFLADAGWSAPDIQIEAREYARCWVILATAPAGIPPGEAYVVDKHSHELLTRRYIDAAPCFRLEDPP